jgi:hypothetical protein
VAYSELIKSFEKIRGYMREFYVYGFKSREQYDRKSARSYDNERRRIESWLGDYVEFRQDNSGKTVFLTVDNRSVPHNPLYKAFKAKSFTDNDVTLHFYVLDLLADGEAMTTKQVMDRLTGSYYSAFSDSGVPDESTVREKLKEYTRLGILECEKCGRESVYRRSADRVDLAAWRDAADFFSEADPLGIVGSYLLDRTPEGTDHFSYKHHYLLNVLDSEMLYELLLAIREHRSTEITSFVARRNEERQNTVLPLQIYVSTQTGRQYLLAFHYRLNRPMFFRIDNVRKVKAGEVDREWEKHSRFRNRLRENLWGVSLGSGHSTDHLEMTVKVEKGEEYIIDRLEREKRCGYVEQLGDGLFRFSADVYDASEMLPWLRTFIGRIAELTCSDETAVRSFYEDLETMRSMYGGGGNAVQ